MSCSHMGKRVVEKPLSITYKSFKAKEAQTFCFSPYILKEFRNRWFVFGDCHDFTYTPLCNLALDRIEGISVAPKGERYLKDRDFHPSTFFKDMIGVTREVDSPVEHVTFIASTAQAPYIRTKPFHESQRELRQMEDGSVLFSIDVVLNYELERDLLGYGEGVIVLSPDHLVEKLRKRLSESVENYEKQGQ